jgi:hypothetical protein
VAIESGTLAGGRRCFAPIAALPDRAGGRLGRGPVLILVGPTVALAAGWADLAAQPCVAGADERTPAPGATRARTR